MVLEVEVLRLIEVADSEPGTGFGFAVEIQQRPLEPALGLGPELVGLEQLEPEHEPAVAVVAVVVAVVVVVVVGAAVAAVAQAGVVEVVAFAGESSEDVLLDHSVRDFEHFADALRASSVESNTNNC